MAVIANTIASTICKLITETMKLENNTITENFTDFEFSDFEAPEGWRKILKPTDVFKMINSQMDIGMFCVKKTKKKPDKFRSRLP